MWADRIIIVDLSNFEIYRRAWISAGLKVVCLSMGGGGGLNSFSVMPRVPE